LPSAADPAVWTSWARRCKWPALEALVAFATPALFIATCVLIRVNPRDRLGQVAGIASLELRFFLFGIALVAALVIAAKVREGRGFDRTARLVCAAAAGLATGLVAGGILVALRGTPFGLHTKGGDVTTLIKWARALDGGGEVDPLYPPLSIHVLSLYAKIVSLPLEHAVKHLQIAGTLAFGPLSYLVWRMLLRPGWALGIAVVVVLPLIDPYKPYPHLVLVTFMPLALVFLRSIRDVETKTGAQILRSAVLFGVTFGVLCLFYSGWFQWAVPGLCVATLVIVPWRRARKQALALLGLTAVVFLLVAGRYLVGALGVKVVDTYIYFDVRVEPMYIAMWHNDLPGVLSTWPPIGELGGVGMYTLALSGGLGLAIAYGRKSFLVIGLGSMMAGAWVLRFWIARMLWDTKLVQLYPRTAPLILYCLIVLTGLAVYWAVERRPADSPLRGRSALVGGVCALLLVFASAGSSTVDRYMPRDTTPEGPGFLAWTAFQVQRATKQKIYKAKVLPWARREGEPLPAPVPLKP
jgi:galactan 5-O-arabinofuranosyltransferase